MSKSFPGVHGRASKPLVFEQQSQQDCTDRDHHRLLLAPHTLPRNDPIITRSIGDGSNTYSCDSCHSWSKDGTPTASQFTPEPSHIKLPTAGEEQPGEAAEDSTTRKDSVREVYDE